MGGTFKKQQRCGCYSICCWIEVRLKLDLGPAKTPFAGTSLGSKPRIEEKIFRSHRGLHFAWPHGSKTRQKCQTNERTLSFTASLHLQSKSLNKSLMNGPVIQNDYFTSLSRFCFKLSALGWESKYVEAKISMRLIKILIVFLDAIAKMKKSSFREWRVTRKIASSAFRWPRCSKEISDRAQSHVFMLISMAVPTVLMKHEVW